MFTVRLFERGEYVIRRIKPQRYHSIDEVPETVREPGIITGYRHSESSPLQAIISLFNATNETLNFWTHFIPTLYFVWQFFIISSKLDMFNDPYHFPFVCYMVTSCCYPLMSCIAHAFSCLSITAAHVCFFLDYTALSLYSWGVGVLYYSYCLPESMITSPYSGYYLPVATANAILATIMACYSRFCKNPILQKAIRLSAFIIPYLWDSVPLLWRLFTCDAATDSCGESVWPHCRQFISVFLASFFYASHLPERLAPGKFDIIGHSHNLLHLFGIIATNEQLQGALIDLERRKDFFIASNWTTDPIWATRITPLILITNALIIIVFSVIVKRNHDQKTRENKVK